MSLNSTPNASRVHIGIFGKTNAGKSSVINALTNQSIAIVSDVKGTTTDPVSKAMELLPLGPVIIIDTPGLDDTSTSLGRERVKKAYEVLNKTDIALVIVDSTIGITKEEEDLIDLIKEKKIPYIVVMNKADLIEERKEDYIYVSSVTKENINSLKEKLSALNLTEKEKPLVSDLINKGDKVLLVIPIDKAAPKGRLILPQQQTIRDILDSGAVALMCKDDEVKNTLQALKEPPKLVITDSQAFKKVSMDVPESIPLTSFSILFARFKGEIDTLINGVRAVKDLQNGDKVLISEGCTHHRQCGDIGSEKIPNWLKEYTKKDLQIEFSSGVSFPENLDEYKIIIHCGGCMLNEKEMKHRISKAKDKAVPMVNYGVFIAFVNGILERSVEPLGIKL